MQSGKHFLFSFLYIFYCCATQTNFILNSDFQRPLISGYYRQVPISDWGSYLIQIRNGLNFQYTQQNGQVIHLGTGNYNGYIQQSINLPFQASCLLEFDIKKSHPNANNSFRLLVGWNGKQIADCFNLPWTAFQTYSLSLNGNTGSNTLRFEEVGLLDMYASYIDNVHLNCSESLKEQAKSPLQQFISKIDSTIDGDNTVPSSIVTLSCFKISPKFIISLFMTFDDFEFYSFHNYRYPKSAQIFFNKANLIQRERLNPRMLETIQILQSKVSFAQRNSQTLHQFLNLQSLNNEELFFIKVLLNKTRSNIFIALLLYLALKVFKFILYIIHTKFVIASFIFKQVSKLSQFWIIALSVFESFSSQFGFHFGIQARLPSYNEFLDKANMFISTFIFFAFVIYSLFGYLLVLTFKGQKKSKTLLYSFKFKNLSYIYQCVFFVLRSLIRSFVHGFLLTNYQYQILVLFSISVIYFIVCFPLKKHFANPFLFALYSTYMLAFAIFDFYFVLESRLLISYFNNDRQMFALVMITIIIFVSLLVFSTFFIKWVIKTLQLMKKIRVKFSNTLTKQVENQQSLDNKHKIIQITNYSQKQRRKNTIFDEQYSPGLFSGSCSVASIQTLYLDRKASKPASEQININKELYVVEKKDVASMTKDRNVKFVESIKDIDVIENN